MFSLPLCVVDCQIDTAEMTFLKTSYLLNVIVEMAELNKNQIIDKTDDSGACSIDSDWFFETNESEAQRKSTFLHSFFVCRPSSVASRPIVASTRPLVSGLKS